MADSTSDFTNSLIGSLSLNGYAIIDQFPLNSQWEAAFQNRYSNHEFRPAKIGPAEQSHPNQKIRGDQISWLQEDNSEEQIVLASLDQIRKALNQELFLSLKTVECHWAYYPEGQGYEKHFDQARGKTDRLITFVYYMNKNWQSGDGGELEIYQHLTSPAPIVTVEPLGGRWIFFRSEAFPHLVKTSVAPRKSLTGWFKSASH